MAEPSPNPPATAVEPEAAVTNGLTAHSADVVMADSSVPNEVNSLCHIKLPRASHLTPSQQPSLPPTPAAQAPQPTQQQQPPSVQPTPPTPAAATAPATVSSSRNSPHPVPQAPTQPIPHGSPTRIYLNQHITPHLLEAMKHLATTEPDKPLKWLSEFLAMKSAEIEGP